MLAGDFKFPPAAQDVTVGLELKGESFPRPLVAPVFDKPQEGGEVVCTLVGVPGGLWGGV